MRGTRLESLRRIRRRDREIRVLEFDDSDELLIARKERLVAMRNQLNGRLSGANVSGSDESGSELILMRGRYRHEYEQIAVACRRRWVVRPGQRERGPRW